MLAHLAAMGLVLCIVLTLSRYADAAGPCSDPLSSPRLLRVSRSQAQPGAADAAVTHALADAICSDQVTRFAGATCDARELGGLRKRVALDVLRLPSSLLAEESDPRIKSLLILAQDIVDGWLAGDTTPGFLERLSRMPVSTSDLLRGMCIGDDSQLWAERGLVPLLAIARIHSGRSDIAHVKRQIAGRLGNLDESRLQDLLALVQEPEPAEFSKRLEHWVSMVELSFKTAGERMPNEFRQLSDFIPRFSLDRESPSRMLALVEKLGAELPSGLVSALTTAGAVAAARDYAEAERTLARTLLAGPWANNILLDLNVGAASLSSRGYTLAGDALAGYKVAGLGADVRGGLHEYDLSDDASFLQVTQREIQVEGWLGFGGEELTFESRLEAKYVYFDSTRQEAAGDFLDETSDLGRAALLLGLRAQPSSRVALGVWLGAGLQYEEYSPLLVSTTQQVLLSTESRTALALEARLRAELVVVPSYLATRARADFVRYSVSRQAEAVLLQPGAVQTSNSADDTTTTEFHLRGFIDLEVARLAGFVPGAYGGLAYLQIQSASASISALIPTFGIGVRQTSF